MNKATRSLLLAGLLSLCGTLPPTLAHAELPGTFGVTITGGIADHHTSTFDAALVWDPNLHWWQMGDWSFSLLGELHAAMIRNTEGDDPRTLGAFGIEPVFRIGKDSGLIRPYVEAGVGIRFLTGVRLNDAYDISTSFQFADMVGAGLKFGDKGQYELGYRFQHLSNASIKRPNPGINFHQVYVGYMF